MILMNTQIKLNVFIEFPATQTKVWLFSISQHYIKQIQNPEEWETVGQLKMLHTKTTHKFTQPHALLSYYILQTHIFQYRFVNYLPLTLMPTHTIKDIHTPLHKKNGKSSVFKLHPSGKKISCFPTTMCSQRWGHVFLEQKKNGLTQSWLAWLHL